MDFSIEITESGDYFIEFSSTKVDVPKEGEKVVLKKNGEGIEARVLYPRRHGDTEVATQMNVVQRLSEGDRISIGSNFEIASIKIRKIK